MEKSFFDSTMLEAMANYPDTMSIMIAVISALTISNFILLILLFKHLGLFSKEKLPHHVY